MQIVCNPRGTIQQAHRPGQGVIDMKNAGFETAVLDIGIACPEEEFKNTDSARKRAAADKRAYVPDQPDAIETIMDPYIGECERRGMHLPIAKAPVLPKDRHSAEWNDTYRRIAEQSVKLAVRTKCDHVIIRPIFVGISAQQFWEVNREFYLSLVPYLAGSSTMILLENQCKAYEGHAVRGICADPAEAAEWVDRLNEDCGKERFGFCMNVGHYNLCGQDMYECVMTLNKRVKAVILKDGDGNEETSLLLFTAALKNGHKTDWRSLIRGLREISYDGMLLFEAEDTLAPLSKLLRPPFLAAQKAVADFFVWQIGLESTIKKYEKVVLFGAGNMCVNYLKNYGEKYPPLFTCDNNANRWGEDFYGLTIHDPKDLLDLPEETGIFICNTFYREIEEQLRNMGVRNPIEYFNDEYLPTINMNYIRGL